MSKLLFDTLKLFAKAGKGALTYSHAKRQDLRNETGFLHTLLTGEVNSTKGARFLSASDQLRLFTGGNRGLLIDGHDKRLSLEDSFKHVMILALTGGGKTSKYIIPNVLELAEGENSIIITDPSGEIFSQTSGYLQRRGFEVLKFDPTDPGRSIYFNPLRAVISYTSGTAEVDPLNASLLASSLVGSSMTGTGKGNFWKTAAESLLEFFLACLKDTPRECHNLYNLYKLVEAMTPDGKVLQKFMDCYISPYPDLGHKWAALIGNAGETTKSQIATTQTAMKPLANPIIARMTAGHTIDFKQFRKKKTILYLTFPAHEAHFYTFLLNIFYTQLFNECMSRIPDKKDLPLFILYDEFGHGNIPYFDMVATNIRKYKVSLSIVLQSVSQLEAQYGAERAKTIIEGGIGSKLFYPGASLQTAQEIEKLLGKVIRDNYSSVNGKGTSNRQEFNLLNADEVRTLADNEALFITGNKKPVLLKTKAYFENGKYKGKIKYGEALITPNSKTISKSPTIFDYL